jgi:hypothetical protein
MRGIAMNKILMLSLLLVPMTSAADSQTARAYYNEILNADGFNRYMDEYVCFPDEEGGNFAVIARTTDIQKRMAANHKAGAKPDIPLGDSLVVTTYFKGVASEPAAYQKVDKDSNSTWKIEYDAPLHGRNVYFINWLTGRYRFLVYALDHSESLPAAETSGKCELIHQ